jgi:hypothetical protein
MTLSIGVCCCSSRALKARAGSNIRSGASAGVAGKFKTWTSGWRRHILGTTQNHCTRPSTNIKKRLRYIPSIEFGSTPSDLPTKTRSGIPKRLLGNERINIAAVAVPTALLAGFAEPATDGRKTGMSKVNRHTNSHIPLKEILNRSVILLLSFVC